MTVKVTIKGGKQHIARPEDALVFLNDALAFPPKSKERQKMLEGALLAFHFGLINQKKFKARGDRRGRPSGTAGVRHRRYNGGDDAALKFMARIEADTGESRPYALARVAVETGHASPTPSQERAIRRLADHYKNAPRNN